MFTNILHDESCDFCERVTSIENLEVGKNETTFSSAKFSAFFLKLLAIIDTIERLVVSFLLASLPHFHNNRL
jgi:hypothetical protein